MIKFFLNLPVKMIGSPMSETNEIDLFKILGQRERYAILRRLMAGQATLSQLGEHFGESPAHIRHHLKILEQAGLVEFAEARPVQGGPEKYYRATRRALFVHRAVLPEIPAGKIGITIGSMDSGVRHLAEYFTQNRAQFFLLPIPLSSLDGLVALRQGICQMSTCHLIDPQSKEYNRSFVRHLFPGEPMALVQVFRREEGLMTKPGNPLAIRSLEDLARPDVLFMNRESGSGVRQWLDLQLSQMGIQPGSINGYTKIVHSHNAVARAVQEGKADVAVGIAASAREFGLDFIPLFEEPYEIVLPESLLAEQGYAPFFDYINSSEFREAIRNLDGYVVPQAFGGVEVIN
jgi:molybdate-binding protein/DNA-binding HxlR family transcriptional regulator